MFGRCSRQILLLLWALVVLLLVLPSSVVTAKEETDLYKILGVKKTASIRDIKKAYRKKALDTHPDKNRKVPPEQAAIEFQKVVHAFEILSDENSRRTYDRTGSTSSSSSSSSTSYTFHFQQRPPPGAKVFYYDAKQMMRVYKTQGMKKRQSKTQSQNQFKVEEAQSRLLHIISLSHLETIMLQDDDVEEEEHHEETIEEEEEIIHQNKTVTISRTIRVSRVKTIKTTTIHNTVDRNLLIAFTTPGGMERQLDEMMLYPYPFAAMSAQGIWWEDILQCVKVRYEEQTKLTQFFNIPEPGQINRPTFIFVRRGNTLDDYERLDTTSNRGTFVTWVWSLLTTEVDFANLHPYAVEIWFVHDEKKEKTATIKPNTIVTLDCSLSHTFWIRDARVNAHLSERERNNLKINVRLSENSTMDVFKIIKDFPGQTFRINEKKCFDLSTTCGAWKNAGHCTSQETNYLSYTHKYCRKTCGVCAEKEDPSRCKDNQSNCQLFAKQGLCTGDKEKFMRKNCPRSCNVCSDECYDFKSDCPAWAKRGDCSDNETYMRLKCPLSCEFCFPSDGTSSGSKRRYKKRRERRSSDSNDSDSDDDSNDSDDQEEEDLDSNDSDDQEEEDLDSNSSDDDDDDDSDDNLEEEENGGDSDDDADADELDELMGKFQGDETTDEEMDRLLHLLNQQQDHDEL